LQLDINKFISIGTLLTESFIIVLLIHSNKGQQIGQQTELFQKDKKN